MSISGTLRSVTPAWRSFWASPGSGDGTTMSTAAGGLGSDCWCPCRPTQPTWLLLLLQGQLGRQRVMELQNLPKGAAVLGEGHRAQAGEGIGGGPWDPVQDWEGRLVRSSQRPQVPGRAGGGQWRGGGLTRDVGNCGQAGSGSGGTLTLRAGHIGKGCPMHDGPPADWDWRDSRAPQPFSVGHHPGHTQWCLQQHRMTTAVSWTLTHSHIYLPHPHTHLHKHS